MASNNNIAITGVVYDGTQIEVTWSPSADSNVKNYVINVTYADTKGTFPQNIAFTAINLTPGGVSVQPVVQSIPMTYGQLDSNVEYFVQVIARHEDSSSKEVSQFVPLITQLPEIICAYYDGQDLHFEWVPTVQATTGYTLNLLMGTTTFYFPVSSPTACYGIIPASQFHAEGLSITLSCVASVYATGNIGTNDELPSGTGVVVGSSAKVTLPTTLPKVTLNSSSYQSAIGITASWSALDPTSGVTSYRMSVYSAKTNESFNLYIPQSTTTEATMQFPRDLAPIAGGYTFCLIALNDSGGGVASKPMPVITATPQLASVCYNESTQEIDVSWNALSSADISSFTVEVFSTSGAASSQKTTDIGPTETSGTVPIPDGGLATAQSWGARVLAVGTPASVPVYSEPASVYNIKPVLTEVKSDGTLVTLSWKPLLGHFYSQPTGYIITTTPTEGGDALATAYIEGLSSTSGAIYLPDHLTENSSCNVQLALVGGISTGRPTEPIQPITTATANINSTCDAVSSSSVLNWDEVTGATDYTLHFFPSGIMQTVNTNSYTLPNTLSNTLLFPGADLKVSIRGVSTSAGISFQGPKSNVVQIPTLIPSCIKHSFDGAKATLCWHSVNGASSYKAIVLGTTGGTAVETKSAIVNSPETSAAVSFTPTSGTTYTIVVQAIFGGRGYGPPSAPQPLFNSGFFLSSASSCPPFTYPATQLCTVLASNTAATGEPIILYLTDVAGGATLIDPIYSNATSEDSVFTLAANTDSNLANYPYTLTISNAQTVTNNPWNFSSTAAIRQALKAEYITFLTDVEKAGAVPFGVNQIQQAVGRMLPQTFAEQLYYNFGLTFPGPGVTQGSVDLRPGMVLRVVINPYQAVGTSSTPWLSGAMGGSVIDYDMGSFMSSSGNWNLGFDSFIGELVAGSALTVSPPVINLETDVAKSTEQGVAEAADLYFPNFKTPFYRLFPPSSTLQRPSGLGSVVISENFSIAAANSLTEISTATNTPTAQSPVIVYFRGRTVLKACIRVTVNGVGTVVPVGTTLANLLESTGRLPPPVPLPLTGVSVQRGLGGAVLDAGNPSAPASFAVRLDWVATDATLYGPNWNPLSMPLLAGDKITLD